MRYKITSTWRDDFRHGRFVGQCADIVDTKTGDNYRDGAFRVVFVDENDERFPVKNEKGERGRKVFYGETAWSDSRRLALDADQYRWMTRPGLCGTRAWND